MQSQHFRNRRIIGIRVLGCSTCPPARRSGASRAPNTGRRAGIAKIDPKGSQEAQEHRRSVNAWEIWTFDPGFGDHPAVIVSAQDRAARKPLVEIILYSTQRASRVPNAGEVLLDSADGM